MTTAGRFARSGAVCRALLVVAMVLLPAACKSCKSCDENESEEEEERERERDHYWRAQIRIVGKGTVKTFIDAFDCTSDGATQSGECGPKLVKFKELRPATMEATPAPGWRLERWESLIRGPDGATSPRSGPMPDGRVYLNGFGYADTGELETVTAVFVATPDGAITARPSSPPTSSADRSPPP